MIGQLGGEVERGGVVVERVRGGRRQAVRGGGQDRLLQQLAGTQPELGLGPHSSRQGGGGVAWVGGRVELRLLSYGHHVHALLPLLRHLQVLDNLARGRAGVVGQVLRQEFAEELLEVGVDGEGTLTSLA